MLDFKFLRVFTVFAAVSSLLGCGGGSGGVKVVKASGKVTIDGQSATGGTLTLTPVSTGDTELRPVVGGEVKSDGTFALTTYKPGDGAAPGDYTAVWSAGGGDASSTDPAQMMAMMGDGGETDEVSVTIPESGSESLTLSFNKKKPKKAAPNALLGT